MSDGVIFAAILWVVGGLYCFGRAHKMNKKTKTLSAIEMIIAFVFLLVVWPHILGYWHEGDS